MYSAWKGAGEAGAGFGTKFKMAAGAGFKQMGSAWSSGIKDYNSRLLTGRESSSHNASSLHVGMGSVEQMKAAGHSVSAGKADATGKATLGNIQEAYSLCVKIDVA